MNFQIGREGEEIVKKVLNKFGIDCEINEDYSKRYDYDILSQYKKQQISYEVKYDYMAEKTGNLAIEINNCKVDRPSGINVTAADFWAHVIKKDKSTTVWLCKVSELKEFIQNNKADRKVTQAGDGNADILLYKAKSILSSAFYRIDNVKKTEFIEFLENKIG